MSHARDVTSDHASEVASAEPAALTAAPAAVLASAAQPAVVAVTEPSAVVAYVTPASEIALTGPAAVTASATPAAEESCQPTVVRGPWSEKDDAALLLQRLLRGRSRAVELQRRWGLQTAPTGGSLRQRDGAALSEDGS